MRAAWLMAVAMGWASTATAQMPAETAPQPECLRAPQTWQGARSIPAARTLGGNPTPSLTLSEPADVALLPVETMILASPLGKPIAPGDQGGLVTFHIALGGTYRIALGGKAWIDVVQKGVSLPSAAHERGGPCSGITKQVDFALQPGDYILQLSDAHAPHLNVLLTREP